MPSEVRIIVFTPEDVLEAIEGFDATADKRDAITVQFVDAGGAITESGAQHCCTLLRSVWVRRIKAPSFEAYCPCSRNSLRA